MTTIIELTGAALDQVTGGQAEPEPGLGLVTAAGVNRSPIGTPKLNPDDHSVVVLAGLGTNTAADAQGGQP